jgi:hypothetical protein
MGAQPAPGAVVAELVATTRFGFMTMEREGAGWSMRAWDANGAPLTSCTLGGRKAVCSSIPNGTRVLEVPSRPHWRSAAGFPSN